MWFREANESDFGHLGPATYQEPDGSRDNLPFAYFQGSSFAWIERWLSTYESHTRVCDFPAVPPTSGAFQEPDGPMEAEGVGFGGTCTKLALVGYLHWTTTPWRGSELDTTRFFVPLHVGVLFLCGTALK